MAEKDKPIPIYCPNCKIEMYMLSIELVKRVKEVSIQCETCGHMERYRYNDHDDSIHVALG